MGVIQNSMNSVTAAAAAAAIAYDKSLEAKEMQQEKGLLAKEQYHEASAELTGLQGEAEQAEEALKVANSKVEATKGWNMEGGNKTMLEGKVSKRLSDQKAAERALSELQDKIAARQAMIARTENIMKRTGVWEDKK